MDPIFDRLGRLIRSLGGESAPGERTSDPDLREAEDELEEFLRTGKERPRPQAQQGPRSYNQQRQDETRRPAPDVDADLLQAYTVLGVTPSATWDEITTAHRNLLKKHHPDRHAGHEGNMKKATAQSQKIGEAYQKIKKHLGR